MIVADTSALISITVIDLLGTFLEEFDVHTTETVIEELEETSEYSDRHGEASKIVLDNLEEVATCQAKGEFTSSRVDQGEGRCRKGQ